MLKYVSLLILWAFNVTESFAQNRFFAQAIIDTLASETFAGRGYVANGDNKAASFISEQFSKLGVKAFPNHTHFYGFSFPVNTFPGACSVKIDGKLLKPGQDYIVKPGCPTIHKKLKIKPVPNSSSYPVPSNKTAILYDTSYKFDKTDYQNFNRYKFKIGLQKKLTWSVSTEQDATGGIDILKSSWPENAKKIRIKIDAKLINHQAGNVLGYIEGSKVKDTFIVLTAHYDHLGKMGKTIFPGANDNASGVAMMLDMANYFSKNPCKYSVAFIAFAGEEAGLIGSKDYTDNPWAELPLSKMKFLVNLDLMGSGEKGMAVVNATMFPEYFNKLKSANDANHYLTGFKSRGKAANSDHYWFTERGVKGFFFYLMGDYNHYHDIQDNRDNLKLGPYYDKSFRLIRDFISLI